MSKIIGSILLITFLAAYVFSVARITVAILEAVTQ